MRFQFRFVPAPPETTTTASCPQTTWQRARIGDPASPTNAGRARVEDVSSAHPDELQGLTSSPTRATTTPTAASFDGGLEMATVAINSSNRSSNDSGVVTVAAATTTHAVSRGGFGGVDRVLSGYSVPDHVHKDPLLLSASSLSASSSSRVQDPLIRIAPTARHRNLRAAICLIFCVAIAVLVVSVLPSASNQQPGITTLRGTGVSVIFRGDPSMLRDSNHAHATHRYTSLTRTT